MNPKHPIKFKWRQRPHYHPIPFGKDIDEFVPEPAPPEPEPPKPKPNPEPADDDLTRKIGRQLLPLVQSHTYNTREEELKRLVFVCSLNNFQAALTMSMFTAHLIWAVVFCCDNISCPRTLLTSTQPV